MMHDTQPDPVDPRGGKPRHEKNNNQAMIDSMAAFVNFLESRPSLPLLTMNDVYIFIYGDSVEERLEKFANAVKVMGTGKKSYDAFLNFTKHFGVFNLVAACRRQEICQRVVTGTKVLPAEPEKTIVVPAKPERTEETWEWECPPSILREAAPDLPQVIAELIEQS